MHPYAKPLASNASLCICILCIPFRSPTMGWRHELLPKGVLGIRVGGLAGGGRCLTAAIPMASSCCSCKLNLAGWRKVPYCCNPYGKSLLQLQADTCSGWRRKASRQRSPPGQSSSRRAKAAVGETCHSATPPLTFSRRFNRDGERARQQVSQ